MSKSTQIPSQLVDELLVRSKRRCALCYQSGNTRPQPGSFAHIRALREDEPETLDNLVYLCAHHHAALDRQGSVELSSEHLTAARNELYQAMDREAARLTSDRPRVFVANGHDKVAKDQLLRFLSQVGLEAVSLTDQPAFGLTILEKLDRNTDISYAIAVLTPDDPKHRARQNVIFELGYFMGRLGRHNVCALVRPGVEVPSAFHGVQYVQMDEQGEWCTILSRELTAAGLPVSTETYVQDRDV